MIVRFEGSSAESSPEGNPFNEPGCVPCKLLGFIMANKTHHQPTSLLSAALDNIMVIVYACEFQSSMDNIASKVLSERHKLEYNNLTTNRTERMARPVLRIVRASSVIRSWFAFEENPDVLFFVAYLFYENTGSPLKNFATHPFRMTHV